MSFTSLADAPRADDFRALARSSPWRFSTVHFTHHGPHDVGEQATGLVEAWLDRAAHRVTVRSGSGLEVSEGTPYSGSGMDTPPASDRDAGLVLRPDGLVDQRPDGWHLSYGDPMWHNYLWTAMLDPVELSDGVQIGEVTTSMLRGRRTWSAVCVPLMGDGKHWDGGYEPRCGCCPLLDSSASRLPEYGPDDPLLHVSDLPTTYLVRLDVETAITVQIDAVDGWGGTVLSNEIHGVDQHLDAPEL